MGNVIGQLSNRDKNTYEILTGQFPFHNDQWGGKKFFGAVKLSTCAKGSINKVAGKGCISNVTVANGGSGYTSMP
ncbi:MAG: hypothetical protein FWC25_00525, partial [Dehalococcoidia bacterium]|nr:hypothetical protein [Dehalococcoidia bacterium]